MPEVTKHPHGKPSWNELATSDMNAAEKFYDGLFGWKSDNRPMGPDEFYGMQLMRGKTVAAIYKLPADEAQMGIPPSWRTYFTVNNADETAKKAKPAGGNVLAEPFDVYDFGRMAVLADPDGAVFSLWQPKEHIGAQIIDEPGAVCWNEVMVNDVDRATRFYSTVLGVKVEDSDVADYGGYKVLKLGDKYVAGVMKKDEGMENIPSHWSTYFAVADCDASVKKAKSLGATEIVPPMSVPTVGRFAMLQDPQGAAFGVLEAEVRA